MNPFGRALLDYQRTGIDVPFILRRDDGFEAAVSIASFFDDSHFSPLEQSALDLCRGKVLDVGAGAGRHSLELQRRSLDVCAVDVLPEAVSVMKERGVKQIMEADVMALEAGPFDTLLMLMNGIGMVGSPSEVDRFLHHASHLLNPDGQMLCDSIDVSRTINPVHVRYREKNLRKNRYPGQQFYSAVHAGETSPLFPWLHLDFATLAAHARRRRWTAELVLSSEEGSYLARLTRS